MSGNINSNFPSIHLTQYSIARSAKLQRIEDLTNQVKGNKDEITKIQKEILAREKIIAYCEESKKAAEIIKANALNIIDYGQKSIKTCEESKEIIREGIKTCEESREIIREMIGICETLIARNKASKAYSEVSECSKHPKVYTTPYDEKYEQSLKNAMNICRTVKTPKEYERSELIDILNHINNNPIEKNYLFSMFAEWFNGFKSSSRSVFRWL